MHTVVAGFDSEGVSGRSVEPKARWFQMLCGEKGGGESARLHTLCPVSAPSQSSLLQASLQLHASSPWAHFSGLFHLSERSTASLIFSLGTGWYLFNFERERKGKTKQNKKRLDAWTNYPVWRCPGARVENWVQRERETERECLKGSRTDERRLTEPRGKGYQSAGY